MITLKWTIAERRQHTDYPLLFEAKHEGYQIVVAKSGLADFWGWSIVDKDMNTIDAAIYHSPTHNELAAKVQAEKAFNQYLENLNTNLKQESKSNSNEEAVITGGISNEPPNQSTELLL